MAYFLLGLRSWCQEIFLYILTSYMCLPNFVILWKNGLLVPPRLNFVCSVTQSLGPTQSWNVYQILICVNNECVRITLIHSPSKTILFFIANRSKWLPHHSHTFNQKQKLLINFHHKGLRYDKTKFQVVYIYFCGRSLLKYNTWPLRVISCSQKV